MDNQATEVVFEPGGEGSVADTVASPAVAMEAVPAVDIVLEKTTDETYTAAHADTASWDSNDLLLGNQGDEEDAWTVVQVTAIEPRIRAEEHANFLGSARDVAFTPLHVVGGGWEFGSLTSVHRPRLDSVNRSEDQSGGGLGKNQRMLSRVFSTVVGSVDLKKTEKLDASIQFVKPLEEEFSPQGQERSTVLCCSRNLKNVVAISIGIAMLYVALGSLRNLQSSMNTEGGFGVYSLAMWFGGFMIGSVISPFIVQRFKPKPSLTASCGLSICYVFANFYPTFIAVFIPASFLLGLCLAVVWSALSVYITEVGFIEAEAKGKTMDHIVSKFFGLLFLTYQLASVLGNLISSLILVRSEVPSPHVLDMNSTSMPANLSYILLNVTNQNEDILQNEIQQHVCGASFCHATDPKTSTNDVQDLNKTFLLCTYACFVIIGTLVIQFFMDPIPNYPASTATLGEVVRQFKSVMGMMTDRKFLMLIPLNVYTVFEVGFIIADGTNAYVTCPLGISMVGYTMICFGLSAALSSYLGGKLVRHVGRVTLFVVAGAINVTSLAFMSSWQPTRDNATIHFLLFGAWGFSDGIWQSQTNSLISAVFPEKFEAAFGCCRFLQGLAGIVLFTMSNALCMSVKIPIILGSCLLGLIGYLLLEVTSRRQRNRKPAGLEVEVKVNAGV